MQFIRGSVILGYRMPRKKGIYDRIMSWALKDDENVKGIQIKVDELPDNSIRKHPFNTQ